MKEIIIKENEAGQRFDKFLFKYFKDAGNGFIYKQLRKKNIVLNNKKSDGKSLLNTGDLVKVFMRDETIEKFRGTSDFQAVKNINLDIIYEDDNVILVNKPSGILSQKASDNDTSINEDIISYLLNENKLTSEELKTFKPGICNRLDRNTSGIIVAGKSLKGLQEMSAMFKDRTMDKYYLAIVSGIINEKINIKGYLCKNEKTNKVIISKSEVQNSRYIETEYEPLNHGNDITLIKVKLITGRTHQIRAHLSSVNHPIIGDYKYGNDKINKYYKTIYNVKNQLLHAHQISFGTIDGACSNLSGKTFETKIPDVFASIIKKEME